MRIFFVLIFFCTFLLAQPLDKITLQLQWKHQFEFAGFYAAKHKGYYEKLGLDVEFVEFESGMNITQEVVQGNADYATSYSSLILDYMQGVPVVMVANFFKQSPIVLVTQEDIKTPKDLVGKKVMGLLDSTHNATLLAMLEHFDVTPDDFTNLSRSFSLDSFIANEVDAMSVFTTNEVYTLSKMGKKYNILDPAAFGIRFYDLNLFTTQKELQNNPQRVEAFRQASIMGWEYALQNKEEIADLILQKYNTQNRSKEALLFEAKQIEYLMLSNVYPIGSIDMQMIQSIANSYKQRQLVKITQEDKFEKLVYNFKEKELHLSIEQFEYLQKKEKILMCVDPDWMPFEMIEDGKHVGIAADFMQLISQKIQTPIKLVPTATWSQSLQNAQNRKCDILALAQETPQRREYLDFTTPYIQTPLVIATKIGLPFVVNMQDIQDKSLGIVANHSTVELLRQKYPGINIVEVSSIAQGLQNVRKERLFGFIDNSMVLNHEIQKGGYTDIAISGQFEENFYLSIATRNDEPHLHHIMQKALLSLDNETKQQIIARWSNITYKTQMDKQMLAKILFFAFLFVGLSVYWNLRLKDEMRKKEEAKERLQKSEENFRTLFDVAPVMMNSFDSNGKIVMWNQECQRVFGYSFDELKDVQNPAELFYPQIEDQQRLFESLKTTNVYEKWYPKTKDGSTVITMWANVVLPNGGVIHIGYDITRQEKDALEIERKTKELVEAKQKLEVLNHSLEERVKKEVDKNLKHQLLLIQQNRQAQMGEMIENIAHQWRQPLAQINSCVLMIDGDYEKKGQTPQPIVAQKLNEIEMLTSYMSKTIDDFKNFFNPEKEKREFFLNEAVESTYSVLKGALNSSYISLQKEYDNQLTIYSYIKELEHVLVIILNNAKDAFIEKQVANAQIQISADEDERYTYIYICDNAGGILNKNLEKIFIPYFTTKSKSQGTGLGLYMAKMIIEEGLRGHLSVYNKNKGACFVIALPKGE